MRIDGITLLEGSKATNLTIASGTAYPSNPDLGELFFRTDLDAVHVYASGGWEALAGGGGSYTAGTGLTLTDSTFSLTTPVSTAYLGSGMANSSTFLRGDGTWASVSSNSLVGTGGVSANSSTTGVYAGVNSAEPTVQYVNATASANNRVWETRVEDSGTFQINLYNDALNSNPTVISINRSANTATAINLTATAINLTGAVTGTSFSGSGASLTSLNASNLASGTVGTARLGSGTANSSTFLRGDGTWASPTVSSTFTNAFAASVASNNVSIGTNANGGIVALASSTASAGSRLGYFVVDQTGALCYRLANDDNSTQSTVFEIDRSANTATAITLTGTAIALVGGTQVRQATYDITTVAASDVDCSLSNFFKRTVIGNMTWTASNVPSGRFYSFILQLANAGSGTMTWFTGTKWAGGTAPTLTASGVDILGFYTEDGGTNWRGVVLALDSK